ncbi:MAG TPA: hypothetical protein VGM54_10075 [Chthoniobacter sp.]
MSKEIYVRRAQALDREMIIHRVPDQVRRVLGVIRALSWDTERDAAPIRDQRTLAVAARMSEDDCSRAIAEARRMQVLRIEKFAGSYWFELLPDSAIWIERSTTKVLVDVEGERKRKRSTEGKSRRASTPEQIEECRAAWAMLLEDGDPEQRKLAIADKPTHPPMGDGGFRDAMAETSREQADARLPKTWEFPKYGEPAVASLPKNLGISQVSAVNASPENLGISQVTHAGAGARVSCHDLSTDLSQNQTSRVPSTQETSVAAAADGDRRGASETAVAGAPKAERIEIPWGSLHEDLWNDVVEVCLPGDITFKQEEDWRARILSNARLVRGAVQEVQRMKKEGKVKKAGNPGGVLNIIYLDWSGERRTVKPWMKPKTK